MPEVIIEIDDPLDKYVVRRLGIGRESGAFFFTMIPCNFWTDLRSVLQAAVEQNAKVQLRVGKGAPFVGYPHNVEKNTFSFHKNNPRIQQVLDDSN
jgi:hypothetical protein